MEENIINWKYAIKQILFEDLLSFTYLGESTATKEIVIVCKYKKEFLNPEIVNRLMFFGEQIKALNHQNLLPLLDFFCYNDNFFAIYPYQERLISLGAYLKENPITLSDELVNKILASVLLVMELLEAKRLVSGNINLYAIFLTQDFEVKLLNVVFPLIILKPNLDNFDILEDGLFYAPEFLINKEYTIKSDIYAFGILSYFLTTNNWPYEYKTDINDLKQSLFSKPAPINEINSQLPFYINQIINICLAKDPEKRFNSFTKIKEALQDKKDLSPLMLDLDTPPVTLLNIVDKAKKNKNKNFINNLKIAAVFSGLLFLLALFYFSYLLYLTAIPSISIPNVMGLPKEEAIAILKENKLQGVISGELIRAGIPAGFVVETKPPVGRLVKVNRIIQIFIAKEGPITVPDFINKSLEEAKIIAKDRNVTLKINQEIYSDIFPEGIIMEQNPSFNAQIDPKSEVSIVLSKGFPVNIFINEEDLGLNPNEANVLVNFSIPLNWPSKEISIYRIAGAAKEKIYSMKHHKGEIVSKEFLVNTGDVIRVFFDNKLASAKKIIYTENAPAEDTPVTPDETSLSL
ncbi:MAG: PASTA domain-containing protein [Candidatus Margulisiibacteriota bacterium]|jgi:serine/threonine-protein kinase